MALSSCFWGSLSVHFLRAKTSQRKFPFLPIIVGSHQVSSNAFQFINRHSYVPGDLSYLRFPKLAHLITAL